MAEGVVIGGRIYPLLHPITGHPIPVFGPKDHGVEFHPGDGYNKKRVKPIDLGVFHWTGSENPVEKMLEELRKKDYGIEFAGDPLGNLFQMCDPLEVDTADAGIANSRSWGIELVNAGFRRASTLWRKPRYKGLNLGPRPEYRSIIHGKVVHLYDFYGAQTLTALALNRLMVSAIDTYPPRVCTVPGVIDLKTSKGGAIGHYNITEKKFDPGTELMLFLARGMAVPELPELVVA